jgi:hypothetical protein
MLMWRTVWGSNIESFADQDKHLTGPTTNYQRSSSRPYLSTSICVSVLGDGLLVDREEVLHEIPITPGRDITTKRDSEELLIEEIQLFQELQIADHVYQWKLGWNLLGTFSIMESSWTFKQYRGEQ